MSSKPTHKSKNQQQQQQSVGTPKTPTEIEKKPVFTATSPKSKQLTANNNNNINLNIINNNKSEDDEPWFRTVTLWAITLSIIFDLGASISEMWRLFIIISKQKEQEGSHQQQHQPVDNDSTNVVQGVHIFGLIAHILLPVPIYLAARARYGDRFLAWQPFEGGISFISSEFVAFVLWVGGLVLRWTQMLTVVSSSFTGALLLVGVSPVFVQTSSAQVFYALEQYLPKSVVSNLEMLSDDPSIYPYVAFLVNPQVQSVAWEVLLAALTRVAHTIGSATFFFFCLSTFDPTSTTRNNDSSAELIKSRSSSQSSFEPKKDNPPPFKGDLLSWLKSGKVFSDISKNAKLVWHHAAVRGTIISGVLVMGVVLYFLLVGLFYVFQPPPSSSSSSSSSLLNSKDPYIYFFFWQIPLPVLAKLIVVMHIVCALITHFIFGFANIKGFSFFQPFVGPIRYIIMQMISWTFFGVAFVLFQAVAPSLEKEGKIPREPWIAANVLSLFGSFLLLITSCCRFVYWNDPKLFKEPVRPSDIMRVSLLFTFALLTFYILFFFIEPFLVTNNSLIHMVMRQLAICAICIAPVSQAIVLFVIPVYNTYFAPRVVVYVNNSPLQQQQQQHALSTVNEEAPPKDATWKLIRKATLIFFAAEFWVLAFAALYVLPTSQSANESSAIVIILCIIAQSIYYVTLQRTCGTAATVSKQHREQQLQNMQITTSSLTGKEKVDENSLKTPMKSTHSNNNKKDQNKKKDNEVSPSSSPTKSILPSHASPKVRRALSVFLDIDEKITINGPFLLSFSLFAHALIFRWTLCVLSTANLIAPTQLNALSTMTFFSSSHLHPNQNNNYTHKIESPLQQTTTPWTALASFSLACSFFAFSMSVPLAHFSIRGLRGLIVNPFSGTPSFAATQVSSWISHIVSFAFLLYLLVNDLATSHRSSSSSASLDNTNRIVFHNKSDSSSSSDGIISLADLLFSSSASASSAAATQNLVRILISVIGHAMLETGAMFLPYVLAVGSVFTFDSIQRRKSSENKTTKTLFEVVTSLTSEDRQSLETMLHESGRKNSPQLEALIQTVLKISSSSSANSSSARIENTPPSAGHSHHRRNSSLLLEEVDANTSSSNIIAQRIVKKTNSGSLIEELESQNEQHRQNGSLGILATVHPAVLVLIVFCLSCTSFLLNLIGEKMLQSEVLTNAGSIPDVALVFIPVIMGLVSCTGAIVISHAWLGPTLHDEKSYVLWMPFRGGFSFILIQVLGFGAYTASFVQTVFCIAAVWNNNVNNSNSSSGNTNVPISLIPVAVSSGVAPLIVAFSALFFQPDDDDDATNNHPSSNYHRRHLSGEIIAGFDPAAVGLDEASGKPSLSSSSSLSLYDNAEAIICLLILFGGWVVAKFTDRLTPAEWASATAPLVICSILLAIAAPLGVVSLRKSARIWTEQYSPSSLNNQSLSPRRKHQQQQIKKKKTLEDAMRELSRQNNNNRLEDDEEQEDGDEEEPLDSTSKPYSSSKQQNSSGGLLAPPLVIVESLLVSVMFLLPFAVVYAFYQLASSASTTGFEVWSTLGGSSKWLFSLLGLGILLTLWARGFFGVMMAYAGTYIMFMVPNLPYIVAVAFPLLRPNSISAIWVPIEFCISVPLPAHWIQPVLFILDSGFFSLASRRLICLTLSYFAYPYSTYFCAEVVIPTTLSNADSASSSSSGIASNSLFGSTILQATEHTFVFLCCLLYKFSFVGAPAVKGSKRSPLTEHIMRKTLILMMERFFSVRIFAEKSLILDVNDKIKQNPSLSQQTRSNSSGSGNNNKKDNEVVENNKKKQKDDHLNFVFGFHPHGILAFTCAWIPISNVWRNMNLPKRVSRFGASIIFNVPLLRDAAMSMGARVVTREAIHYTLAEQNETVSAMLVPGGQSEMLESRASSKRVVVKIHHKGFLKIALRKNKAAVPVFCFGEHDFLENIQLPKIQKFFLKLIGFGLPVVPMGALGFLPLPTRTPLTLVVGKPVFPEDIIAKMKQEQQQSTTTTGATAAAEFDEDKIVDRFADEYFGELRRVFYKYREEAGYPEMELIFAGKD